MRVLVVADVKWWVFDRYAHALMMYSQFHIDVVYGRGCNYQFDHTPYNVILWLVDVRPDKLRKLNIPKEKVIYAVRSDVYQCKRNMVFRDPAKLGALAGTVLSPNRWLHERLSTVHPRVFYAPGGVDTGVFNADPKPFHRPAVVGWAGSLGYFGAKLKGYYEAEEACRRAGMTWYPAVKEDRHRTMEEMVEYYKEIDIYIDLCRSAGRQNGLLEAMASGKLVFATSEGVAPELIRNGRNGYLVTRENVISALMRYGHYQRELQMEAKRTINAFWSWNRQANILDRIIEEFHA